MRRTLLALIPALAFVALPQPAAAFELPNGDVVWDVATADFYVRIEQTHGSELGSMTLTKRATGEVHYGDLSPAFIYDRDGSEGLLDEFYARGLFAGMLIVEVELYDWDGTAFDGAPVKPGYPAALMIPSPPPAAYARPTTSATNSAPSRNITDAIRAVSPASPTNRERAMSTVFRGSPSGTCVTAFTRG